MAKLVSRKIISICTSLASKLSSFEEIFALQVDKSYCCNVGMFLCYSLCYFKYLLVICVSFFVISCLFSYWDEPSNFFGRKVVAFEFFYLHSFISFCFQPVAHNLSIRHQAGSFSDPTQWKGCSQDDEVG